MKTESEIHWTLRHIGESRECIISACFTPNTRGSSQCIPFSQLRRYVSDPSHILDHSEITVGPTLRIEQKPVGILDRREKVLHNRIILLVRVAWSKDSPGDSTWEKEEDMRKQYPYLFPKSGQ
ncbi:uncharacterized protein M6B38_359775 [Iris pallida]|uniref:Chromo domain-containing protein n=1 Tax=Iris pallida TaxID=29817 RepID=A0AAX6GLA4_IRIPA|nr:uncharacterized protein M6B38_359775 [Iris pallida]